MATLAEAKRIVVKIGSALLVERSSGALRQNWLASLAEDIAEIVDMFCFLFDPLLIYLKDFSGKSYMFEKNSLGLSNVADAPMI